MPVAVTENVAVWPEVIVWLAGCTVIAGAEFANPEPEVVTALVAPAHPDCVSGKSKRVSASRKPHDVPLARAARR